MDMRRNILLAGLTLASLLVALPGISSDGRIKTSSQNDQADAAQTESSKQGNEEKKPVYDMDGKRLRADEKHVAELTLKNGRIIAYGNNKREIGALIKALKEDGVTDEKVLNPESWVGNKCLIWSGVCHTAANCTSLNKVCKWVGWRTERAASANRAYTLLLSYCECP